MPSIAFTYEPSTAIGLVRLYSGDMEPDGLNRTGGDRTRTDSEIAALRTNSLAPAAFNAPADPAFVSGVDGNMEDW